MGYRHIDTAQAYGNEAAVGDGIERAEVDREQEWWRQRVKQFYLVLPSQPQGAEHN